MWTSCILSVLYFIFGVVASLRGLFLPYGSRTGTHIIGIVAWCCFVCVLPRLREPDSSRWCTSTTLCAAGLAATVVVTTSFGAWDMYEIATAFIEYGESCVG